MQSRDIIMMSFALILAACATPPKDELKIPTPEFQREMPYTDIAPIDVPTPAPPNSAEVPAGEIDYMELDRVFQTVEEDPKKYSPLIYGTPKPLVCSHEYPAEGPLMERPNLQVMWEHYIYERPERVWEEIGGAVYFNGCLPEDKGGWKNACTVRLSHMLNKAGHKIPHIKGQTVSGESGDYYFFRLDDAQAYITETFGEPDITVKSTGRFFDAPSVPGLFILKFAGDSFTGHATIWNGAGAVDGADIVGYEIYFWKLPCFIPPERKKNAQ